MMNHAMLPDSPEIETLKRFYDAINRFDLDACVRDFDPEIVRVEPSGHPTAGTHHGIAAIRDHLAQGRGTWAEGTCQPTRFAVAGDKVVAICHVHVRQHGKTDFIEGDLADVFTFRAGKITAYQTFWEPADGLAFAGAT